MSRLLFLALTGPDRKQSVALRKASRGDLHLYYLFSLWALRTLGDLKLDFLTLFQSFEAIALNSAVMDKDV